MPACFATNEGNINIALVEFPHAPQFVSTRRQWRTFPERSTPKYLMNPALFIGLELSLVPEVEQVFVDRTDEIKAFRVVTVVNRRDPAIRSKIYKREQAIIAEFSRAAFDFQIVAREDRDLKDVIRPSGELTYKKG